MANRDDDISRGFSAGNYANAYATECLETALAGLSMNRSDAYRAAYVLGFYSSYERHEMPDPEAYDDAMAAVGARAKELGFID